MTIKQSYSNLKDKEEIIKQQQLIIKKQQDVIDEKNNELEDELIAKCDRFKSLKYSSSNLYAFTEQGRCLNAEYGFKKYNCG